jgi:hypothetical protein
MPLTPSSRSISNSPEKAPRPYHFVILSDHGQSGGATFKQRYGKSLEDVVQELAAELRVEGFEEASEGFGHMNAFLTEAIEHEKGATTRRLAGTLKHYTVEDEIDKERAMADLASEDDKRTADELSPATEAPGADELPNIVVLASGNLGLVYGTRLPRRATLEEIETLYPGVLDGLAAHEGIGFLMVRSGRRPHRRPKSTGRFRYPGGGPSPPRRHLHQLPGYPGQQFLQV